MKVERAGRRVSLEDADERRLVAGKRDSLDVVPRFGKSAFQPVVQDLRAAAVGRVLDDDDRDFHEE
jgi:hypothetical protein